MSTRNNFIYNSGKQLDISYNALNLPRTVDNGANGKMQFVYNAAGQKLRTTLYDSPSNITDTSDYIGNFIYKNGQLSYILMPEGRILPNGSSFTYEYHLKDQFGNTRATYIAEDNGNATLTQTTAYYPFGLPKNALSRNLENNPYLYNGKELHSELNLDLFDYGARYYDAEVARWWSVDPLAEKRNSVSPYNYAQNNPILRIDPNGMDSEIAALGGTPDLDDIQLPEVLVTATRTNKYGNLSPEQIEDFYNSGLFDGGPGDPPWKNGESIDPLAFSSYLIGGSAITSYYHGNNLINNYTKVPLDQTTLFLKNQSIYNSQIDLHPSSKPPLGYKIGIKMKGFGNFMGASTGHSWGGASLTVGFMVYDGIKFYNNKISLERFSYQTVGNICTYAVGVALGGGAGLLTGLSLGAVDYTYNNFAKPMFKAFANNIGSFNYAAKQNPQAFINWLYR